MQGLEFPSFKLLESLQPRREPASHSLVTTALGVRYRHEPRI